MGYLLAGGWFMVAGCWDSGKVFNSVDLWFVLLVLCCGLLFVVACFVCLDWV